MVKSTGIRTFELDVSISGPLSVPFDDWPANIKDGIYAAMERLAAQVQLPLQMVYAEYKIDHDKQEDEPGRHFLHVIVSEIVIADERTLNPDSIIRELPEDIRRLMN